MSADKINTEPFTKENLDTYLKELAKEFKKLNGKIVPAELILIGGAAVLVNYGFRDMTYDVDAVIISSSAIKMAINNVGDRLGLPNGWLNTDFIKTKSYTPKLAEYSKYYKTFSNILQVRTISKEYLVAMKLMAGRRYKNDLSDIIGIIIEQNKIGEPLSIDIIKQACINLYGTYDNIPQNSRDFLQAIYNQNNLEEFYNRCRESEIENKDILVQFEKDYKHVLNASNLDDILNAARKKKENGE